MHSRHGCVPEGEEKDAKGKLRRRDGWSRVVCSDIIHASPRPLFTFRFVLHREIRDFSKKPLRIFLFSRGWMLSFAGCTLRELKNEFYRSKICHCQRAFFLTKISYTKLKSNLRFAWRTMHRGAEKKISIKHARYARQFVRYTCKIKSEVISRC